MLRGQFKVQWWGEEVLSTLLTSLLHNSDATTRIYATAAEDISQRNKELNTNSVRASDSLGFVIVRIFVLSSLLR